jgi:carboxylate-amine ligase
MKKKKKPLKRSMSGEEIEFFLLNKKGLMVNEAAKLMDEAKKKYPLIDPQPEAGQNMVEIASFPSVNVLDTFIDLLERLKMLIEVADSKEYVLYPNATYPGTAKPRITKNPRYLEQAKLFGTAKALQATQACGFHYHYTLPRGVFDHRKKFLKESKNSKITQSMMDSYNLSVALDPALTTIMQSSPFVQGRYIGKDSRLLIYRGGKKLDYMKGKYSMHQSLGGLPPYKQTLNDLMFILKSRQKRWEEMMLKKKLDPSKTIKRTNILDFAWNPVRINKLGTLELRGMDMNHPKYIMGIASLLKFLFRKLYRDFYRVMPSDIGFHEPFKIEGNIIHIPPHTHVRNYLQGEAAYRGFDSKEILAYTKRFYRMARQFTDDNYVHVVKPILEIIDEQETVSDKILKFLKKKGYGKEDKIPNSVAAECALKGCEKLLEEVDETEEKLYKAYNIEPKKLK